MANIKYGPGLANILEYPASGLVQDFNLAVVKSEIDNHVGLHKFGANLDIATDLEDIWTVGGVRSWLQGATTLEVVSTSGDDDAAGVAAQNVTIEGLDANFAEITETIATSGTVANAGTLSFMRVNQAYVGAVGTYGTANAGTITIQGESGGTVLANIVGVNGIGMGETEQTHFTVPAGKTAYIEKVNINVDSTKNTDVYMFRRENADDVTTPFSPARVVFRFVALNAPDKLDFDIPLKIPEKTDFWFAGVATASGASVEVDYGYFMETDS